MNNVPSIAEINSLLADKAELLKLVEWQRAEIARLQGEIETLKEINGFLRADCECLRNSFLR